MCPFLAAGDQKSQLVVQEAIAQHHAAFELAQFAALIVIALLKTEIVAESAWSIGELKIDRAAKGVRILIRGQRFGQFDAFEHFRRDHVQIDAAIAHVGGGDFVAVDGDGVIGRRQTANDHPVAFAAASLNGHAGEAADGFGGIGVGQFHDAFGGDDIFNGV